MSPAGLPVAEAERLAALLSYDVLDTASEEAFDELVRLAARLTASPMASISLIDAERQWFKARHGIDATETHRDLAFCAHTILSPDRPLLVTDARLDERFQSNPLVTGPPDIRAYLGVCLVNPEGHALGSLCVIDVEPRSYDAEAVETMRVLARAVVANLELRRALRRTSEAAMTDALTGLPNRRAVMAMLEGVIDAAGTIAVIALDLDHFKEANDGEGHAAGDALLCETAKRLREAARPGDMVGRVGGDEFVVMLVGVTERDIVTEIARRISTSLKRPVEYGGRRIRLGATLGVAIVPEDVAEAGMALRVADDALACAKRHGRGTIGLASPRDEVRLRRNAAIVRAFDMDCGPGGALAGATVHLQPIVALGPLSGAAAKIASVEALARWSHSTVGEIPPAELFEVIGPERAAYLGQVIREQALAAFAALRHREMGDARVALNLSAGEVSRADIALHVAEQVERAGLSLRSVEIEITEEVLLDRVSDHTLDQLAALRGRGARLVLDDFGTGNSGLAQLLRLPLDGLKLDKRFVQRLGTDARAEQIVRATVSLAHGMGLSVTAEGVESEHQAAIVKTLGCDAGQGFLFSPPLPPDGLREWLDERSADHGPRVTVLRSRSAREPARRA